MQRLEVSGAVRPIYGSSGVKLLSTPNVFPVTSTGTQTPVAHLITISCFGLKKFNKMQLYTDIYLLLNYCTCFGRPSRPSSGVHKTVVAASGTDHNVWGASFFTRDQIRQGMICTRGLHPQT